MLLERSFSHRITPEAPIKRQNTPCSNTCFPPQISALLCIEHFDLNSENGRWQAAPCALMKRSRLKKKTEVPGVDELAFPPPFSEQAKYLALADKFLSMNGTRHKNVIRIDSSKHFKRYKSKRVA